MGATPSNTHYFLKQSKYTHFISMEPAFWATFPQASNYGMMLVEWAIQPVLGMGGGGGVGEQLSSPAAVSPRHLCCLSVLPLHLCQRLAAHHPAPLLVGKQWWGSVGEGERVWQ